MYTDNMYKYFVLRRLLSGCEVGSISLKNNEKTMQQPLSNEIRLCRHSMCACDGDALICGGCAGMSFNLGSGWLRLSLIQAFDG